MKILNFGNFVNEMFVQEEWLEREEIPLYDISQDMDININYEKLILMGLLEYSDIVEECFDWFKKQMKSGNFGKNIIPPLDDIKEHIIRLIGFDYKGYISEEKLDNLSRFIYQEIDKNVFD